MELDSNLLDDSLLSAPKAVTPKPLAPPEPKEEELREFGDVNRTRTAIYDNVLKAAQNLQPVSNGRHTLRLTNVAYQDPDKFSKQHQKQAILNRQTLARRMQGVWELVDDATGDVIDRKKSVVMSVPHMTERGTFINKGTEYALKNQQRLLPGVYTRIRDNGEIESHANILPGVGQAHRYYLDPAKGMFRIKVGQGTVGIMPLLKAMGATKEQLMEAWGRDLYASNFTADDPQEYKKLKEKFLSAKEMQGDENLQREALVKKFQSMQVDPEVTKRTLGKEYNNLSLDALLDITKKLIRVSKKEDEPDDRDSLPFQQFFGPEDLFAERIARDKDNLRRTLLWKMSQKGSLKNMPSSALNKQLHSALLQSGLGIAAEEINTAELLDKATAVTRLGEGGIPSLDSIPDEARSVQPSMLGFIDPLRTPESGRAGVDTFLARGARKGPNNKLYVKFNDARTGKPIYKTPQQLTDLTIGFPRSLERNSPRVAAMRGGKMIYVPKNEIDLIVPSMEDTLNPLSNLIPGKGQIKGQRLVMASRMTTQALPVVDAESPWVRAAVPGTNSTQSFEEAYADKMGALKAQKNGRVLSVSPDEIKVQYEDGTTDTLDIYNNFPLNRKTRIHQDPVVQPGQTFTANQLLAKSNYTDKTGATALGRNARTAYMVWEGKNFEDAVVISKSFAKKMTSEHIYQHELETNDKTSIGKKKYIQHFPSKYDKKILEKLDDNGVIKPGTEVKYGDPLILGISQKDVAHNRVHKQGQISYGDSTVNWEHHDPGVVTDVVMSKNGPAVIVKSLAEMRIGDKISGRMGDKGVLADIIDDEDMPKDSQGRPFEVLANPLGLVTRTNAGQMAELWLGKIAELQGKPFKVEDFDDSKDLMAWVKEQLQQNNLKDYEDVVDPKNERRIKNIATGNRFFMKLHHMSEQKSQGRSGGAYTAEGSPAKGGVEGSKRIGILESNALLAHGATDTLQDVISVRSNKNEDYWMQFMQGYNPKIQKVPYAYEKFVNQLKASGVNVVRKGTQQHIMALTDRDIDTLAGDRELTNASGVDWGRGLQELPGGLFDKSKTGGHGGNQWSYFKLHEPMPNPVMEEPIRRILGLTQAKFEGILSGETQLDKYGTGPTAIKKALENINIDKEIELARNVMNGGKASQRDAAVRKLGYLKAAKKLGLSLADYTLTKVPVIPPSFRPVSVMSNDMPLVSDANYLYKELFEANDNLKKIQASLGTEASGAERLATYRAFKAVTGLGDPIGVKTQEKNIQGFLKNVFGSSPKFGTLQRKLISTTVDNVGRGVISPDPNLDMDQVGIPEDKAFKIYERFVTRNLVRRGMSLREARQSVKDKTKVARDMLLEEMERRPVYISRAPVLHKFGILAAKPQITKGDVLRVSPLVVKGFNADFDGDSCIGNTVCTCLFPSSVYIDWSVSHFNHEEEDMLRAKSKLVTSSPLVTDDVEFDGNVIKHIPIEKFPRIPNTKQVQKNGVEVYEVPEGVKVLSYDKETGKSGFYPVSHFSVHPNLSGYMVTYSGDFKVGVSEDHSLYVYNTESGQLEKTKPADAINKLSPVVWKAETETIDTDLVKLGASLNTPNWSQAKYDGNAEFKLGFDFGWWLGVVVSDAWTDLPVRSILHYAKVDPELRKRFIAITDSMLKGVGVNEDEDKSACADNRTKQHSKQAGDAIDGQSTKVTVYSTAISRLVNYWIEGKPKGAVTKRLPAFFASVLDQEGLFGLLSGLLDGDGTVDWQQAKAKKTATFNCKVTTSSPRLKNGIILLCQLLGIRTSVTVDDRCLNPDFKGVTKHVSYIICFSKPDIIKHKANIKLTDPNKRAALAKLEDECKDDLDIVPADVQLAKILRSKVSSAKESKLYSAVTTCFSRGSISRKLAETMVAQLADRVPTAWMDRWNNWVKVVQDTSVTWKKVLELSPIEKQTMYDLTVPDTNVFSANNGLIIWDTMNYHVPSTDAAVKEAYERLLPSKNLFSLADFKSVMHKPANEYITGLYFATQPPSDKQTRIFRSKADAMKAYESGTIDYNDKIRILEP